MKVAVVDSGVEAEPRGPRGSVLPGNDYVNPGGDGRIDPDGHGTHVAGIIAAHVNNALGIAGAAPGVKILPVRVLDANGGGVASNVAKGIIWATDHGARVINLSLGGGASPGIQQAMQYANSKGAVVVAAAGNNGQAGNAPMYPAAYPEAIAVAAVDTESHAPVVRQHRQLPRRVGARRRHRVDVGQRRRPRTRSASGTSMATPYAAAEAALIIAANRSMSADACHADHGGHRDARSDRARCSGTD